MRKRRLLPAALWPNLLLIILPGAALVCLEILDAEKNLPLLGKAQAEVKHTLHVLDVARQLDRSLEEAQRGERGFLITGRSEQLLPYQSAIEKIPGNLVRLRQLIDGDPNQQFLFGRLQDAIQAELIELRSAVAARRGYGFEAAREIEETRDSFASMREIGGLMDAMIEAEEGLLVERRSQAADFQRVSLWNSIVEEFLALLAMIVGVGLLIRNLVLVARARRASVEN